jgi:hypothetical protein
MKAQGISFDQGRLPRWGIEPLTVLLLLVGAICLGFASKNAIDELGRLRLAEGAVSRSDIAIAPRAIAARDDRSLSPRQVSDVGQAVRQLNLPWSGLLDALEAATADVTVKAGEDVRLVTLKPDAGARKLFITARTSTPVAVVDYVRRLKEQAQFEDAVLRKYDVKADEGGAPVEFVVEATWRPEPEVRR